MENNGLLLLWIVLFPMLGAVINGIAGCFLKTERKLVHAVAVGAVALSFSLALYLFFFQLLGLHHDDPKAAISAHFYEWFQVQLRGGAQTVSVPVAFTMDALSGMMTVMITGIGLLIHVYSTGYMSDEPSYARFFAYLNLFMASMLILVLANNFPLMFVGWEGVGVCSYLLIGFWFENSTYAAAGKKAFIVNRIGDLGVLTGMFLLLANTGSFEFAEINSAAGLARGVDFGTGPLDISVATLAALFLFLGCAGKSAQLPLFVWLPDAMAGPTPVSALIHAATMVTSGVYLCCRLSPVIVQSPTAMAVIAIVGTLTALLGASIALVQNQLKKVLAYSTVSQLGFMFAAVGVGAFGAGIFHVLTHAFFKACLFLGAGSVMHAVHAHGDADFKDIGGLKKWMPITNLTFFVSCLAIAGVPPFSGFFSKDMILHGALGASEYFAFAPWLGQAIFGALVLAAAGTAFYMFRLYYLTFTGAFRGGHGHAHDDHATATSHGHDDHGHGAHGAMSERGHGHAEPHESELPITAALVVLAIGATLVGFLGMPAWFMHLPDFWSEWLHGVVASIPGAERHHHDQTSGAIAMGAGLLAGVGGFLVSRSMFKDKPWRAAERMSPIHRLLMDKWRVDELYDLIVVRPLRFTARLSGNVDRIAVDGLTKLAALAVQLSGFLFTRLQNGVVHAYGTATVFGLLCVTWWTLHPHVHVDATAKGDAVHFVAGAGMGYEYRWDFNSDGVYDTEWSKGARDVSHAYDEKDLRGVELVLSESVVLGLGAYRVRLEEGDAAELDTRHLGPGWQTNPHSMQPPWVRFENGKLRVRHGASSVSINGVPVEGDDIPVAPGQSIQLGQYAKMRVDGLVEGTVSVRNVFGNVVSQTKQVVVAPSAARSAALETERGATRFARRGDVR